MAGPLSGKIALVTGATSGIGFEASVKLAAMGATLVLVARDRARGEAAVAAVKTRSCSDAVSLMVCDFASLSQVRALAAGVMSSHPTLHILVNNAGSASPKREVTEDGIERTFAVNHLAPFLLTNLLLDRLRASAPARIVTVASQAHRDARLDVNELTRPRDWTPLSAYNRSKACNILFTRALARRVDAKEVTATCLHPGVVATAIGDRAGTLARLGWRLAKPFLIGPEKGAAASLFLATVADPTPFHGSYVIGNRIAEPDTAARDDRLGEQLWTESARLVGL